MASEQINRQVNVFINSGEAEKALERLTAKEKALNAELSKTTDPVKIKKLKTELDKLSEPIDRMRKKVSGELRPSLVELQKTVDSLGRRLKHMSESDADFKPVLRQYRQAQQEMAQMKTRVDAIGSSMKSQFNDFAKNALFGGGIIAAVAGVTSFIKGSITEALDADEATARFKSTLDNLGRSDAFDRIIKKADEIATQFKYLDNDEVVGVFNKLIDYGKLTEQQMNDLLPVIINFAAKQRISIEESTSVIVKALEGNGKALKEYGINIKDAGTDAERLQVIMGTLADKVDGAGEAFQGTAAGGLAVFRQEIKNLQEEIGNELLPIISKVLNVLSAAIKGAKLLPSLVGGFVTDIAKGNNLGTALSEQAKKEALDAFKAESADESIIKTAEARTEKIKKLIANRKITLQEALALLDKDLKSGKISQFQRSVTEQMVNILDPKVLGIKGSSDTTDTTKKEDPIKKDREALRKFLEGELVKIQNLNSSAQERELNDLFALFEEKKKLAHGNHELLLLAEKLYQQGVAEIQSKYGQLEIKKVEERNKARTAALERLTTGALGAAKQQLQGLEAAFAVGDQRKLESAELKVLSTRGKARLEAEKALLDEQERQAVDAAVKQGTSVDLVHEQFRQKRQSADAAYWTGVVDNVLNYASTAAGIFDNFSQARTNKENAELERDRRVNDKKKDNFKRQLDGKKLTQLEYDRAIAKIDAEQEKKERAAKLAQFRRDQRASIIQAIINGAQGASKTIAQNGFPAAIPFLIAEAVALASQIKVITSQKPQFARGGALKGPSHAAGGVQLYSKEGHHFGEAEGGEGIVNKRSMGDRSRYQVSGTPSQIASGINALHGGVNWEAGATVQPVWRSTYARPMNFAAIRRSFAAGGVVEKKTAISNEQSANSEMQNILFTLAGAVNGLTDRLEKPIRAVTLLSQHEDAQARMDAIRNDATFK